MKKLSLFIAITLIAPTLFIFSNQTAQAQFVVTDPGNTITNTINTSGTLWDVAKNEVLIPVLKLTADRLKTKVESDIINWASGGDINGPGIVTDYAKYIFKDTQYEVLNKTLDRALDATNNIADRNEYNNDPALKAKYDACISDVISNAIQAEESALETCDVFTSGSDDYIACENEAFNVYDNVYNPGQQNCQETIFNKNFTSTAINNYKLYNSGQFRDSRDVFTSLALHSVKSINNDKLNNLIDGGGKTIDSVTGSRAATEEAISNLDSLDPVTGALFLLSQADNKHNVEWRRNQFIANTADQEVSKETNIKKDDLQTPQKVLDKKKCVEYKTDENGNRTNECAREVATTIGSLVSSKLKDAIAPEKSLDDASNSLVGQALLNALVKKVGDIMDQGISGLVTNISSDLSGPDINSTLANITQNGIDYQSQFDPLGNTGNNTSSGSGTVSIVGNTVASRSGTETIGGPEDAPVQIEIILKDNLEIELERARQEQEYYNLQRDIFALGEDTAVSIDQCIPGPDYDWQDRYKDTFSKITDETERTFVEIGLRETEKMVNDPKVTIPGAITIRNTFSDIISDGKDDQIKNKPRVESTARVISTIEYIKSEVLSDFNNQKNIIDPNLVIFKEDWDKLSQSVQENLLGKAIDNTFFVLKPGETIDSIVLNQNERARDAVLNMAWKKVWRQETPTERKTDLRYSFHLLDNHLSNDRYLAEAKNKYTRTKQVFESNLSNLSDCLVFRAYALGVSESSLNNIISSSDDLETLESQNNQLLALLGNLNEFPVDGSSVKHIDISKARSDSVIKSFLISQANKQSNNEKSLLKTKNMTLPSNIQQSILGFESETDKIDYFELHYPDEEFEDPDTKNSYSIKNIFKYDRMLGDYKDNYGLVKGILFCRNRIVGDIWRGTKDVNKTACLRDWYIATKLDYESIFSEI